ncbi:MAG TPA: hypothetical protein ENK25_05290 [Bacteroidetes bacterium]|nr:hypothetical protein [Bacteroidota bacterium]
MPCNGRHEWYEYLPIKEKSYLAHPEKGFFATTNQNITFENYTYSNAGK